MNFLNQLPFLKALGWTLLDSLWQMGILWLLYVLLTANGKKFQSNQRHTLALFSLMGGSLWFVITFFIHFNAILKTPAAFYSNTFITNLANSANGFSYLPEIIGATLSFFSIGYLIILSFLFIKLYRQYNHTKYLYSNCKHKAAPELRIFLKEVAGHIGIKKEVRIWLSDLVDTPLTIGFWKPVILLPVAAINQLTIQQAEAIILHELNHIKRNDYIINLLIACVDVILFFNPFARIFTEIIKKERENSCDDMVLQFRYDASQYAKALLMLEKNRVNKNTIVLAATGKSKQYLLNRIKRMLNNEPVCTPVQYKMVAYMFAALVIGAISWFNPGKKEASQQPAVNPAYVVANNIEGINSFSSLETDPEFRPTKNYRRTTTADNFSISSIPYLQKNDNSEIMYPLSILQNADIQNTVLNDAEPETMVSFASAQQPQVAEAFSIAETEATVSIPPTANTYPYVPSSSYSYQLLEDSTQPKKQVAKISDIKARQALEKSLMALEEIDWQTLEKQLTAAGKKIDIIKLQDELKKAMEKVDWKKINEEAEASLLQVQTEDIIRDQITLRKLQELQKEQQTKLNNEKKILNTIIQERICEDKHKTEEKSKKNTSTKVRKIVYI